MEVRAPEPIIANTTWKILIIDDDEDDYVIAAAMLKEARGRRFEIHWVDTFAAARDELLSNSYHAVLVDYDLGVHSGIELIREANQWGYAAPLILFTGRGNYEVDVEAMEAGATLYLTKGEVNPLLLERAIRYAIEIKQRENDLREARKTAEHELIVRRRAEEELRKSEAILRRIDTRWNAALESIDVGVIIATEDEQVIYWNPAAQEMHGFTRSGEGIEPLEKTPITFQLWTPDGSHLLALDEWPMRRIKRGEPVRGLELRIRRPDQGWEKIFNYSGVMVDTAGGERLIFLTCEDLTEKRRIEDALRESEERLLFALTTARMVAWEYDPATLQVTFSENAEEVLEIPKRLENSDQGYGMIHPDDLERHRALVAQAIATGGSYESVYRHPHTEKVIWLEEHGRAKVDAAGNTVRLVGVVQNITARKQAEEALKESQARLVEYAEKLAHSNQELEAFAFVASHDLQEPLRKVTMFSDSLRRHLHHTPDKTVVDYLNRMQEATGRMRTMIDGLLDLSRVNTKGKEFTPVDLNLLLQEVVEDLEAQILAVNGQVTIEPLPSIEGDEVQIRELFQNLISNGLKFHKPNVPPVVQVSGGIGLTNGGPVVEIRVDDNGIGIEPQYARQIFQPFQRLHGKGEYEGTGLGLAICQKIIERHHGTIEVESTPGNGSGFIIHLPIKPA